MKFAAAMVMAAAMSVSAAVPAMAASKPADGTYDAKFNTAVHGVYNYKMFCPWYNDEKLNDPNSFTAKLTVKGGKMTIRFRLSGTGYDYLYPGTEEEAIAAGQSAWYPMEAVELSDGTTAGYYTMPITTSYIFPMGEFTEAVGKDIDKDSAKAAEKLDALVKKAPVSGHSQKEKTWYGSRALKVYVVAPKTTSISKVKAGKKYAKVTLKKNTKNTSGYQIRYSRYKSMKKAKTVTITSNKTTSKTIKKLTRHKKYYFQVRTYNRVAKTIYSGWSAKKSVKIK